jgi:hypothetical protein
VYQPSALSRVQYVVGTRAEDMLLATVTWGGCWEGVCVSELAMLRVTVLRVKRPFLCRVRRPEQMRLLQVIEKEIRLWGFGARNYEGRNVGRLGVTVSCYWLCLRFVCDYREIVAPRQWSYDRYSSRD